MSNSVKDAFDKASLVSLGFDANMVRFETGTVFKEGESGMEHMASFNL